MGELLLDRPGTVSPTDEENELAKEAVRLLASLTAEEKTSLRLSVGSGESEKQIPIPESALQMLNRILDNMARGNIVRLISMQKNLTTQEAAFLLNVSRPFVLQLIESGELPVHKVGTHRRIRYADLMEYKRKTDEVSRKVLMELAQEAQELGLGYQ